MPQAPLSIQAALQHKGPYRIDYLAVFPPRHPLNHKPGLRLADLIPHPLITGTESTIGRAMLEQARFRLGIADELNIVAAYRQGRHLTQALTHLLDLIRNQDTRVKE